MPGLLIFISVLIPPQRIKFCSEAKAETFNVFTIAVQDEESGAFEFDLVLPACGRRYDGIK